jgi:hypothetical protein
VQNTYMKSTVTEERMLVIVNIYVYNRIPWVQWIKFSDLACQSQVET